MSEPKIRKARKQDISRIAELIVFGKRTAYRDIFKDDIGSFKDLQVLPVAEEILANRELLESMTVYDDGIIKGVIAAQISGKTAEISDFYVEPVFKENGIGRALMEHVIMELKESGIQKVFLWVLQENLSARRFYEAFGFRATGETGLIEGTKIVDMYYELLL